MLSQLIECSSEINQRTYYEYIRRVKINQLKCECGYEGKQRFVKHGYYKRSVKTKEGKVRITILRVKCVSCGKTHAILHPEITPYRQVGQKDMKRIIRLKEKQFSFFRLCDEVIKNNPEIKEENIKYIIRGYKRDWLGKLKKISSDIIGVLKWKHLNLKISELFFMAFSQGHRGYYGMNK